jgi:hypothetical protein
MFYCGVLRLFCRTPDLFIGDSVLETSEAIARKPAALHKSRQSHALAHGQDYTADAVVFIATFQRQRHSFNVRKSAF